MADVETAIIRKIRKLLALAEKAGTEHEAEAAAAQAARLMEAYKLSEAEIQAASEVPADKPREKIVKYVPIDPTATEGSRKKRQAWHDPIISGLSAAFHVRWFISGNTPVLFGRETSVQACQYLFAYLTREIDRLSDVRAVETARREGRPLGGAWHNAYKLGAAQGVQETLLAQRRAEVEARKAWGRGEASEAVEAVTSEEAVETSAPASTIPPERALAIRVKALAAVEEDEAEVAREYVEFSKKFGRAASLGGGHRRADAYFAGRTDGAKIKISGARADLGPGAKRIKS